MNRNRGNRATTNLLGNTMMILSGNNEEKETHGRAYILEYKRPGFIGKWQMAFQENTDGNETLIWVISPAGKKSLVTKMSAREHWGKLIKQGWYRVE